MAKPRGGGAKPQGGRAPRGKAPKKEEPTRADDVYEADDGEAEWERHAARFDKGENYEYEMPSDFEDEDIDDEMAFTEEDKKLYGHMFDDEGPAGGADASDGSGSDGSLLSSGEEDDSEAGGSGSEEEEEGSEEEGGGGRQRRRRKQDELDELFGEGSEGSDEELGSSSGSEEEGAGGPRGAGSEEEEDEAAAAAAHAAMLEAVVGGGGGGAERRRRKAKQQVVTEAYPESAYNLPAATGGGELTVGDLIAGLGDSKGKLGAARKALERLEKKGQPVAAPLPGPIKQRQERKAGYEESKKEADKWVSIVKANREAPTLRFTADKSGVPRVTTTAALAARHKPETDMEAEVAALLEAAGAHSARAVAEAEEALAMKALSVEEARERQNRLARMRALLFYHEAKSKRLKKIKSKEYRRKLKKAEKRKASEGGEGDAAEEEMRLALEEAEFDRAKERLTLKHRNTSRWARRAIKRGQTLMDEGTREAVADQLRLGEELRKRVNRMKPADGGGSDASTSASDDDSEGEGGQGFAGPGAGRGMGSKVKAAALELLEGKGEGEAPSKGLFALPFMKRALERRKLEAQQAAEEALEELGAGGGGGGGGGAAPSATPGGAAGRLAFTGTGVDQRAQWERVARLEAAAAHGSDLDSGEDEDAEAKAKRLSKRLGLRQQGSDDEAAAAERLQRGAAQPAAAAEAAAAATAAAGRGAVAVTDGPISIDLPGGSSGGKRRRSGAAGGQPEQPGEAAQQRRGGAAAQDWLFSGKQGGVAKLAKAAAAGGVSVGPASAAERQQNGAAPPAAAAQVGDDGVAAAAPQPPFVRSKAFAGARPGYVYKKGPQGMGYYQDQAEALRVAKSASAAKRAAARREQQQAQAGQQQQQQQRGGGGGGGSDSEEEEARQPLMRPAPGAGLSQADLIRAAFAGDDVADQFAADKAAEVEGELPQEEVPGVLPGWGTWAGHQREPKWAAEAKRKAQQRKDAAAASRKDAKLQYVVISEKWDKKSAKFKTPSVPFPFDSKETYERAMRQPLGREYNTDASFRNLTRPAVEKDAGVIIEPIRFSKAMAQHGEQAGKNAKRAPVTVVAGGMPKKSRKR